MNNTSVLFRRGGDEVLSNINLSYKLEPAGEVDILGTNTGISVYQCWYPKHTIGIYTTFPIRNNRYIMVKRTKKTTKNTSMKTLKISKSEHNALTSLKAELTILLKGNSVNYREIIGALIKLGETHKDDLMIQLKERMGGEYNE